MDRSKMIFGNAMTKKTCQKACSSKKKFSRKFGDDAQKNYKIAISENPYIGTALGVQNITLSDETGDKTFDTEKGIIVTGVIDAIVEEIPALVYCNDTKDNVTPTKGPKKAPIVISFIAILSLNAIFISSNLFRIIIKIVKPISPAIILIWVDAKAL